MDQNIKQARRLQQPALVALWGASSSGKTYSALQIAHGMCREDQKIGMIDTENKRGQAHVGTIPRPYYTFDIDPPFTADKYIDAFNAFEKDEEFGIVIIDSYSHAWVGEGGALAQADGNAKKGLAKWIDPKSHINRLLTVLMRSRLHVIVCMREKMSTGNDYKGPNGAQRYFDTGFVPIAEKNTMFEMGVSFWLNMDHKPIFTQPSERCFAHERIPLIKAPPAIESQLKVGEFLSPRHGKMIADWYRGDAYDLTEQGHRAAARGTASLKAWVSSLIPIHKDEMVKLNLGLKTIAAKADSDEAERKANLDRENVDEAHATSSDESGNAFLDQFTPECGIPQPTEPPPAAPEQTEREKQTARFNHGLNTVDWTFEMADNGADYAIGKKGVDALWDLANLLGPVFVQRFKDHQSQVFDKIQGNLKKPEVTTAPNPAPTTAPTAASTQSPNNPGGLNPDDSPF